MLCIHEVLGNGLDKLGIAVWIEAGADLHIVHTGFGVHLPNFAGSNPAEAVGYFVGYFLHSPPPLHTHGREGMKMVSRS